MSFGGNTKPKKTKKPAGKPWTCGCGIAQPAYIFFCKACQKGQAAG